MINYGLSGKVALVTGVSRKIGISAAISHYLAASGANIFTTSEKKKGICKINKILTKNH